MSETLSASGAPVSRPPGRPRSESSRRAILDAAFSLLEEQPYSELTADAIAKRAGASKQTLYRWWRSKAEIVLEALCERAEQHEQIPQPTGFSAQLENLLSRAFDSLRTSLGGVLQGLIAEAQLDPAFRKRLRDDFILKRRAFLVELLESGKATGDVEADADVNALADLMYGALWYRLLLGHAPLDVDNAQVLIANIKGLRIPATPIVRS